MHFPSKPLHSEADVALQGRLLNIVEHKRSAVALKEITQSTNSWFLPQSQNKNAQIDTNSLFSFKTVTIIFSG